MKKINIMLGMAILGFTISSCTKDVPHPHHPFEIRMTDAPGPYDAVYIDLQAIEITGSGSSTVLVDVNAGIYNLLDFSNGVDTLIAAGILEDATVQQIRLILGPNNTVVVNGVSHPLSTPSAEQSGLKLQVHETLQADVLYSILLDFDANQSIVEQGNGSYSLKPVIRTIVAAESGTIKGQISTPGTIAVVTATSDAGVNYSSNVVASGDFQVMGLPPGDYIFTITPLLPLNPIAIVGITVTAGVATDIGTVVL